MRKNMSFNVPKFIKKTMPVLTFNAGKDSQTFNISR